MKFTILENAISSLAIAVDHFKIFYYDNEDELNKYRSYESQKICLVFLENGIELLLKALLLQNTKGYLSIFVSTDKEPYKSMIEEAKEMSELTGNKLEDCLIKNTNLRTIPYGKILTYYINDYCKSHKVERVLRKLGEYRNAITHFGVDFRKSPDELICCVIETFDVIYNYLYPELISLDERASYYFTKDDLIIKTPEGLKTLIDQQGSYNNFLDFVDELLIDCCQSTIMTLCSRNIDRNLDGFISISRILTSRENYTDYFKSNHLEIKLYDGTGWFEIIGVDTFILPYYSSFYNITVYSDNGSVIFIVHHDTNDVYQYIESVSYPCYDEPENDAQWMSDLKAGKCKVTDLKADNLFTIIKEWCDDVLFESPDNI